MELSGNRFFMSRFRIKKVLLTEELKALVPQKSPYYVDKQQ